MYNKGNPPNIVGILLGNMIIYIIVVIIWAVRRCWGQLARQPSRLSALA
jgi:flagellar biogenesis protein FliO